MTSWCAGMPVVSVPQSATPKAVTIILPFYENAQFLRRQIGWWGTYPDHIRAQCSAIIVDDGSPTPAAEVLAGRSLPFPIRLFRITKDVRWNWLAARNIGAYHAPDGWCLLTDMDHVVPESTATALVYGQHNPARVYAFSRMEQTGTSVSPHSASFLMTRKMFWEIGGYDERYAGLYGTDGLYRRRLRGVAPVTICADRLVRYEYDGDSSTTAYARKLASDAAGIAAVTASIPHGSAPRVLSFAYEEVPLGQAVLA